MVATATVEPETPTIEPDADYPVPEGCTGELGVALMHHLLAALNRQDAAAVRAVFADDFWFDLGRDPVAAAKDPRTAPTVSAHDMATLAALVRRFDGLHISFVFVEPSTSPAERDPQGRLVRYLGSHKHRVTGQPITAAGKRLVEGSGKGGIDCATGKFSGLVLGFNEAH